MRPLADAATRRIAVEDAQRSLLVEASAGTGKTKTLVDRIVHLVVDEEKPLASVAAMTFTEKAAGEMKERLRRRLDEVAREATDPARRARAEAARRDLDSAEVSTIHSFCARLLRERPVEARVDPEFVTPEEGVALELFEQVFEEWADGAARAGGPVADALRRGLSPAALRDLAAALHAERTLVLSCAVPADPLPYVRAEIEGLADLGDGVVREVPQDFRGDPKVLLVLSALDELRALRDLDVDALAAFRPVTEISFRPGKRGLFAGGLKARAEEFRDGWKELPARLASLPDERLLGRLVAETRDGFLPRLAEAKRTRGLLDFDDLLLAARDLLRRSPAARAHFRSRFEHFVVDEFQDTDPVQAEVVLRLASASEEQDGEEWESLEPGAGALFLVGDPKQSIYRFRRADVETYRRVAASLGPEARLPLVTNFRSAPRIIGFVNALFGRVLAGAADEPWEVGYTPLVPPPEADSDPDAGEVIYLAAPPVPEPAGEAGEAEADDDAADAHATVQEARAVANLLLARFPSGGFRGAAVLLGSNDAIDVFQDVFRAAGIPAVLDGGVSFYRREETAAVVAALRAVDDPSDGISAVAALKSFLFGVTDVELLDAAEGGARFDDPTTATGAGSVAEALATLAALRARRLDRPLAETLLDLLSSRRALAAVENGAVVNPLQAAANLERMLVLARGLDAEGLPFREAVARLALRLEERTPEPRAFEEDEDAVRLLTLHKSKGLEFDTVVVAGLGFRDREKSAARQALVYNRAGGTLGVRVPFGGATVGTPGLKIVAEWDALRRRAEEKRLLYVALTRPRKTLVLSWFRRRRRLKSGESSDAIGKSLLEPIAFAEAPPPGIARLVEVVEPDVSVPPAPEAPAAPGAAVDLDAGMREAEARLERARATASRPLRRSGEKERPWAPAPGPSAEVAPEDLPSLERSEEVQARAVRLGTAVHEAMELLLDPSRFPAPSASEAVALAGAELDAAGRAEALRLVARLLEHPVVARARAARRRFVELPVLFRDDALPDAPLVEGKIDLLFEEADGWVVVDWKTDRLPTPGSRAEREALYAPQLASYARAVVAVLGSAARVKETLLAFARD